MLSINATLEGDKIVLRGLRGLQRDMPKALQRTLTRAAIGTHRESQDLIQGAPSSPPGSYPGVPVRSADLLNKLRWLRPNDTHTSDGFTFETGPLESGVYDFSGHAASIHEGYGSSAKFGARPFLTDGFERFNRGDRLAKIAAEEIEAEARKKGFK